MSFRRLTLGVELGGLLLVVAYGASAGPERMALHWGLDGEPDRVGSKTAWVVESAVLWLVLTLAALGVTAWVRRSSGTGIHVPHKEHWTRPEQLEQLREMLLDDVYDVLGDVVLLVTALELVAIIRARQGHLDLPVPLLLGLLGLFGLSVGWRVLRMRDRYEVPSGRR